VHKLTLNQYHLLFAHNLNLHEKSSVNEEILSKEQSDKLWEDQMAKANERIQERKKTKEQSIEEAQQKIIKQIEENKK
jgi:DnaJ-domain-containing protein 1